MAKKKVKAKADKTVTSSKAKWILLGIVVVILFCIFMVKKSNYSPMYLRTDLTKQSMPFDFSNMTIMLDEQKLTFVKGAYVSIDQTHTASIMNRSANYLGNRAAAIVVDNPGGSGTFYYLVGAMHTGGKVVYSEPVSLGDRIKISSITVDDPQAEDNGMITVEYLDRPADAAMAVEPTEKMTARYSFEDNGNLIEVLQ